MTAVSVISKYFKSSRTIRKVVASCLHSQIGKDICLIIWSVCIRRHFTILSRHKYSGFKKWLTELTRMQATGRSKFGTICK